MEMHEDPCMKEYPLTLERQTGKLAQRAFPAIAETKPPLHQPPFLTAHNRIHLVSFRGKNNFLKDNVSSQNH